MKLILPILITFLCINIVAQNAIKFDYDAGGNLTQRYIQVFNFRIAPPVNDSLLTFNVFPNPSNTHINLEGGLDKDTKVAHVKLYNINGQTMLTDNYYGELRTYKFNGYPAGVYFLEVHYSRERKNTYRILITQ